MHLMHELPNNAAKTDAKKSYATQALNRPGASEATQTGKEIKEIKYAVAMLSFYITLCRCLTHHGTAIVHRQTAWLPGTAPGL